MPKARVDVTESAPSLKVNRVIKVIFVLAVFCLLFYFPSFMLSQKQNCVISIPRILLPNQCVHLDKTDNEATRMRGLSGRASMPETEGMLFIFDEVGEQCIWMKDMNFSLDIIWLDKDKKIIEIKRNVSPATYPETFCVENTNYVIELNEGIAEKAKLKEGQKLNI